jgi:hypothetical protein
MAVVGAGDGGAVTVGSSIRNSIVAKKEYGVPAGLSGLARHIFLTTIPSSKGKEGGMNGLSELRECH